MTSSASPLLRFELQATGDNLNVWGTKINAAMSRLEDSIAKTNVISLGTGTTYDLSAAVKTENYIADESRCAVQQITGSPTGAVTITTPNTAKTYWVDNQTSKAVTFVRLGGGASATVRASQKTLIYCDGSTWTKMGDITLDAVAAPVASVDLNSQKITSLATGTVSTDAINLAQLNAAVASLTAAIAAAGWTVAGTVPAGSAAGQTITWNGTGYVPGALDLSDSDAVSIPFDPDFLFCNSNTSS
jgi:hypothetical protein